MRHITIVAVLLLVSSTCLAAPTWSSQTSSTRTQFTKEAGNWIKVVNTKKKSYHIIFAGVAKYAKGLKYARAQAREPYQAKGIPLYYDMMTGYKYDQLKQVPGVVMAINPRTKKSEATNLEKVSGQDLFDFYVANGFKKFPGWRVRRLPFRLRKAGQKVDAKYLAKKALAKPYDYKYYYKWTQTHIKARIK